jgi:hypothetical protein
MYVWEAIGPDVWAKRYSSGRVEYVYHAHKHYSQAMKYRLLVWIHQLERGDA